VSVIQAQYWVLFYRLYFPTMTNLNILGSLMMELDSIGFHV